MSLPDTKAFRAALRTYLLAGASVAAKLGTRLWWVRAEQRPARPFAVMSIITTTSDQTHDSPVSLQLARVQIDVFADTAAVAADTLEAIKARMAAINHTTVSAVIIEWAHLDNEIDGWDDDPSEYRITCDYNIYHQTAA